MREKTYNLLFRNPLGKNDSPLFRSQVDLARTIYNEVKPKEFSTQVSVKTYINRVLANDRPASVPLFNAILKAAKLKLKDESYVVQFERDLRDSLKNKKLLEASESHTNNETVQAFEISLKKIGHQVFITDDPIELALTNDAAIDTMEGIFTNLGLFTYWEDEIRDKKELLELTQFEDDPILKKRVINNYLFEHWYQLDESLQKASTFEYFIKDYSQAIFLWKSFYEYLTKIADIPEEWVNAFLWKLNKAKRLRIFYTVDSPFIVTNNVYVFNVRDDNREAFLIHGRRKYLIKLDSIQAKSIFDNIYSYIRNTLKMKNNILKEEYYPKPDDIPNILQRPTYE